MIHYNGFDANSAMYYLKGYIRVKWNTNFLTRSIEWRFFELKCSIPIVRSNSFWISMEKFFVCLFYNKNTTKLSKFFQNLTPLRPWGGNVLELFLLIVKRKIDLIQHSLLSVPPWWIESFNQNLENYLKKRKPKMGDQKLMYVNK